jgi:excisionase family DNA binding protein
MTDRLAYRIPEVCDMLGISRWTLYRDAKAGKIEIEKRGRMSFVFREALERYRSASFTTLPQALPIFEHAIQGNTAQRPATSNRPRPSRKQRLRG